MRILWRAHEYEREIAGSEAIGEVAAAYAECPKCGSEHYPQRPIRS